MAWRDFLCRADSYAAVIERLLANPRAADLRMAGPHGGVSLAELETGRDRVARALADDVRLGQWIPKPYRAVALKVDGKTRHLVLPGLVDRIVSAVVTDLLAQAMEPGLPDALYSYRPGRSTNEAVASLARLIRSNRQRHADPRMRGVFVCRRDVQRYTESIPVHATSPLWTRIAGVLDASRPAAETLRDPLFRVVEMCVRPLIGRPLRQLCVGLPVGAPINTALANLYLLDLDRALAAIDGLLVARYGDDIVCASTDRRLVERAGGEIDRVLDGLGLSANPAKSMDVFLNAAGRRHHDWADVPGAQHIEHLGFSVSAQGTVGLKDVHVRRLLRDLRRRADSVARALVGEDKDTIGRTVCQALRGALSSRGVTGSVDAIRLLGAVTDRDQLRFIDHEVARMVAGAVSGDRHARALRKVPWSTMKRDWRLPSVVMMRNKVGG